MNEPVCFFVKCLVIPCHINCVTHIVSSEALNLKPFLLFQTNKNVEFFSSLELNLELISHFDIKPRHLEGIFPSLFVSHMKVLQYEHYLFFWTPWESKHSQLLVGSRLPANQNSEHHVLLPGETCLPKFLASKHRHVEFVRVAICLSTANSTAVTYLSSGITTSHQSAS